MPTLKSAIKAARLDAQKARLKARATSDETFVHHLQPVPAALLVDALFGDVDPAAMIANELAARGLDCRTGKWVGFTAARTIADQVLADRGIL